MNAINTGEPARQKRNLGTTPALCKKSLTFNAYKK
jgi:hypothetical protein